MNTGERLSQMQTMWSLVRDAHRLPAADKPDASSARRTLLVRYRDAAHRYLLGAVRDPDIADELFQDFAVRFMRGDFHRADPGRGRFRDFLRTALIHLVSNHRKHRQVHDKHEGTPLPLDTADPTVATKEDSDFLSHWRGGLLYRAWSTLAESEAHGAAPYHTVLRAHYDAPGLSSTDLARQLNAQRPSDEPLTATSVRKCLERARRKFAEALVEEVAQTLDSSLFEDVAQELTDLGLLVYCKKFLADRVN